MEASTHDGATLNHNPAVYQGHFGPFTITERDRREVVIYRSGLGLAALSVLVGSGLVLWQGRSPWILPVLTALYGLFSLGLGISLWTIHIYLRPLHRLLQTFWAIGTLSFLAITVAAPDPFIITVSRLPVLVLAIGFSFAALTGIFFKEAFCFNRLETKGLTLLTPAILLGHLTQWIPAQTNLVLIDVAAVLMVIFVARKAVQPMPQDIGDKSVFEYQAQQRSLQP